MSRASITSKRSQRRSKDSSRDGVHLDKQAPAQMDTIGSVDDKEKNCKSLVDKSSSAISNSESPQQSQPHVQKDTVDDSPKGALAA
ncbi:hypothetical protein BDR04DRAFT_1109622 [Suillus decipiens]|nr:hypothetical protein BDR04DRAFT_1109622 [Suillus decipiens]